MNPGPVTSEPPCSACDKRFSKNARKLVCIDCGEHVHLLCSNLKISEYNKLRKRRCLSQWKCDRCTHCQKAYPCGICNEAAIWTGKSLQCDECDKWVHLKCIQMGDSTYEALHNQSNLWFCPNCGVTNNTELINSYNKPVSNSYGNLNHDMSLEDYTDLDSTVGSNTSLLVPKEHSTPEARRPTHIAPKLRRAVKVIVVNCRCIQES